MSETIRLEILLFSFSIYTGVMLTIAYDILRLLRYLIRHTNLSVNLEDFCYWIFATFLICKMVYEKNHGEFRGYIFVGLLTGFLLVCLGETLFRKIWIKLLKKSEKKVKITSDKMNKIRGADMNGK